MAFSRISDICRCFLRSINNNMYQNIIPGHLSDWLTRSTCPQEQWEDSNGGALRAFGEDESSYVEVPLGGFEGEIEKGHLIHVGNQSRKYGFAHFLGKLKPGNQETTLNVYIDIYIYTYVCHVSSHMSYDICHMSYVYMYTLLNPWGTFCGFRFPGFMFPSTISGILAKINLFAGHPELAMFFELCQVISGECQTRNQKNPKIFITYCRLILVIGGLPNREVGPAPECECTGIYDFTVGGLAQLPLQGPRVQGNIGRDSGSPYIEYLIAKRC